MEGDLTTNPTIIKSKLFTKFIILFLPIATIILMFISDGEDMIIKIGSNSFFIFIIFASMARTITIDKNILIITHPMRTFKKHIKININEIQYINIGPFGNIKINMGKYDIHQFKGTIGLEELYTALTSHNIPVKINGFFNKEIKRNEIYSWK